MLLKVIQYSCSGNDYIIRGAGREWLALFIYHCGEVTDMVYYSIFSSDSTISSNSAKNKYPVARQSELALCAESLKM